MRAAGCRAFPGHLTGVNSVRTGAQLCTVECIMMQCVQFGSNCWQLHRISCAIAHHCDAHVWASFAILMNIGNMGFTGKATADVVRLGAIAAA